MARLHVPLLLACFIVQGMGPLPVYGDDELNAGRARREDLLIYNRVPKSGSSSMQDLLAKLRSKNRLKLLHYVSPPYAGCPPVYSRLLQCMHNNSRIARPPPEAVQRFAHHIDKIRRPNFAGVVLDYHFHYLNFTALGLRQPLYINTLRDPVDRVVSQYSYARYGNRPKKWRDQVLRAYGDLPVEECVALYRRCGCEGACESRRSCTRLKCADLFHNLNSQLLFFCPWGSPACAARDSTTLEVAKAALLDYDAVGVLERMDDSLALFETVLPKYFAGATLLGPQRSRTNLANTGVGDASLRESLMQLNALDMEFYRFAVERLDTRLQQLRAEGRLLTPQAQAAG